MKKNLIQALKKLLVAFGGARNVSEITDTNIVPMVDKLADAVSEFLSDGGDKNIKYLIEPQTITTTGNETEEIQIVGLYPSKTNFVSDEEVIDYFNNNIIVKINNQKAICNMDLGAYILNDGETTYILVCPSSFNENDETAIWFTLAGTGFDGENIASFTPVATEYTIEAYEIIENTTNSDDAFIINVNQYATTPTTNNMMGVTLDKTFEEISAAFAAGKRIYAKNHKAYYNPSFIYQGTTLMSIHIRWYQQMLEDNRPNKHIIFYEINNDDRVITSYIYKVNATIYEESSPQ